MSIEVRPRGVQCAMQCTYCYEENSRDRNAAIIYEREKVLAAVSKLGPDEYFSLFGGEPMELQFEDFEELLRISFERYGKSGLQTNGTLIREKHIELFKKYNTHVGISLDGPIELNDSRWMGTLEATRKASAATMWSIERLCQEANGNRHKAPSLIVTIHARNCAKDKFAQFLDWFRWLDSIGVYHVNLHVLEMDHKADTLYLPPEEIADRLIDMWRMQGEFKNLRFLFFDEIMKLLQGREDVVCVWHTCDPWNTSAVQGIEHDGSPSHCSRTNKDGKNWLPAEGFGSKGRHSTVKTYESARSHERQMALAVTPQEDGGCKDCEYWVLCFGNCPGTGSGGDWRQRSTYCSTFKRLFAEGERLLRKQGIIPLSDWKSRKAIEDRFYWYWTNQMTVHLEQVIRDAGGEEGKEAEIRAFAAKGMTPVQGGYHGDFTDNG